MKLLLLLVATAAAQRQQRPQCRPINEIFTEEEWAASPDAQVELPEIVRTFNGPTSANCEKQQQLGYAPDSVCLKLNGPDQPCVNRRICGPTPAQFFKFPFYEDINAARKDEQTNPQRYSRQKKRSEVSACMTCYAKAAPHNAAALGPLDPAKDLNKPSVTVSTRIACAKELLTRAADGSLTPFFSTPNGTYLEQLSQQLEELDVADSPCVIGIQEECTPQEQQRVQGIQQRAQQIVASREQYIQQFLFKDQAGDAVQGHKRTLMEIPFGSLHVIRAEVGLTEAFPGWTNAASLQIPSGQAYAAIKGSRGCAIFEYGMVVASPGQVSTACWLTPLFHRAGPRRKWVQRELEKEQELLAKVQDKQQRIFLRQMRRFMQHCERPTGAQSCRRICAIQDSLRKNPEVAQKSPKLILRDRALFQKCAAIGIQLT